MTDKLIQHLLVTPYAPGGSDWSGVDCWGVVEVWFREAHGIELADRGTIPHGPEGMATGFDNREVWREVETPQNSDLVVMRSYTAANGVRQIIQHGHCGILTPQGVIHSNPAGVRIDPLSALHRRVTCILRHRNL